MDSVDSLSPWLKNDPETWQVLRRPEFLIHCPAGAVIREQSQASEFVYIVESGRAMLRSTNRDGKEIILMFAEKGAIFGEQGIFVGGAQPFSAVAIVDCALYRVPAAVFTDALERSPALNRAVMAMLARKVNLHISQVLGLSFGDVRYRIAGVMVYLAAMYGVPTPEGIRIDLPFTHQDMADLVKSSRVTVSKVLHAFQRSGILKKQSKRYIILDLKQLESIVQTI